MVAQLIETFHDLAAAIDMNGQVDFILMNFENAFDHVSHQKLLLKPMLKNDKLLAWIEAHLSMRSQWVTINGVTSTSAPVKSSVPQGSILELLFFLLFINDIVLNLPVKIKLFADDCILYQEIHSNSDQETLNTAFAMLQTWCAKWQMTINYKKKTVAMRVMRKKRPILFTCHIDGHALLEVTKQIIRTTTYIRLKVQ